MRWIYPSLQKDPYPSSRMFSYPIFLEQEFPFCLGLHRLQYTSTRRYRFVGDSGILRGWHGDPKEQALGPYVSSTGNRHWESKSWDDAHKVHGDCIKHNSARIVNGLWRCKSRGGMKSKRRKRKTPYAEKTGGCVLKPPEWQSRERRHSRGKLPKSTDQKGL